MSDHVHSISVAFHWYILWWWQYPIQYVCGGLNALRAKIDEKIGILETVIYYQNQIKQRIRIINEFCLIGFLLVSAWRFLPTSWIITILQITYFSLLMLCIARDQGKQFWISLHTDIPCGPSSTCWKKDWFWVTRDDTVVAYDEAWAPWCYQCLSNPTTNEPSGKRTEKCVRQDAGYWKDHYCDESYYYICERGKYSTIYWPTLHYERGNYSTIQYCNIQTGGLWVTAPGEHPRLTNTLLGKKHQFPNGAKWQWTSLLPDPGWE